MVEFIVSFFTALTGGGIGIGIVLLGFSKYLGGIWSNRIERLEKNELDIKTLKKQASIDNQAREHSNKLEERLKKLEQEHEKLLVKDDQFHQISQQTYENIFEKRIEAYTKLFSLSHKIEKTYPHLSLDIAEKVLSGKYLQQIDDVLLSAKAIFVVKDYKNFIEIADEHLTVLSQEVLDAYFTWQDKVNVHIQKNNSLDMKIFSKLIELSNSGIVSKKNTEETKASNRGISHESQLREAIIYQNNFDLFQNLKSIIREDIKVINQRVDNTFK